VNVLFAKRAFLGERGLLSGVGRAVEGAGPRLRLPAWLPA
jgi:hypothetical protein